MASSYQCIHRASQNTRQTKTPFRAFCYSNSFSKQMQLVNDFLRPTNNFAAGFPGFLADPFGALPGFDGNPFAAAPNSLCDPFTACVAPANNTFFSASRRDSLSLRREGRGRRRNRTANERNCHQYSKGKNQRCYFFHFMLSHVRKYSSLTNVKQLKIVKVRGTFNCS